MTTLRTPLCEVLGMEEACDTIERLRRSLATS
jgi:hypothetical protein